MGQQNYSQVEVYNYDLITGTEGRYSKSSYEELGASLGNYTLPKDNCILTNPYLICVSERYVKAKIKMMLVSKETNFGWMGEISNGLFMSSNVAELLMKFYTLYSNSTKMQTGAGPWMLKKELEARFPNLGIVNNNFHLFGYLSERTGTNPHIENHYHEVLKSEIQICQPDIVLFCTSKGYDKEFEGKFGKTDFTTVDDISYNVLAKVEFKDMSGLNGIEFYRTYHPLTLLRYRKNVPDVIKTRNYINNIIDPNHN